ncbi:MAG: GNAT family N-acetyltransferase, partial [Cyanobacteria bacterium J06607_15]
FTPAVGYRFLVAPGEDEGQITDLMVAAIDNFCDRNRLSGCNFLFVDPDWREMMEARGFSGWLHHGYIWSNRDFSCFDDYLKMFNSNQRKNIKRERKAVAKAGLYTKTYVGQDIPRHLYSEIYRFYSSTCNKFYWGSKYLTRQFFEQLYPNYSDRVLLVVAYTEQDDQRPVGMSFCLQKGDRLYGRYWGCYEEYNALHFEACYYKPIEWAIANGIKMYDPGAGGRHKKRRGFPATANHSLHRFYNPRMAKVLHNYIDDVNRMSQEEITAINNNLPFNREEISFSLD